MPHTSLGLTLLVFTQVCVGLLAAQPGSGGDAPVPFVPQQAWTQADLDHREACKLYAQALCQQRDDCLLEATKLLEAACRLDPEAILPAKALIPLYTALCRNDDALAICRKVLDLNAGEHEVWRLYAQQLKTRGQLQEARKALMRATACPDLSEHPELRVQICFDLGVLAEETREYAQAIATFDEVSRILEKPEVLMAQGSFDVDRLIEQAASTQERIGKLCLQTREFGRAEAAFRKAQALLDPKPNSVQQVAARIDPAEAAFRRTQARRLDYNLAQVCLAQGKPAAALERLEEYLRTQPQGLEPYELKVTLLKQLGRESESLPALKEATQRDPHNLPLRVFLARQYAETGHSREAEDLYKTLAERAPTPEVYRGLFTLYQREQRLEDALQLLNSTLSKSAKKDSATGTADATAKARVMLQVLRDDTSLAKAFLPVAQQGMLQGQELERETRYFLAVLAARTHQLQDAERFFRSCLNDRPVTPQAEWLVYEGLIRILWEARKYDAIVEICQAGLRQARATNRMLFHSYLAKALVLLGKTDEALAEADQAVNLSDPGNRLYSLLTRVDILRQAGRYEQAAAECQALLKEFHQSEEIRNIRHTVSGIHAAQRDYPRAEEQLQLILKADPNDATANNDLGYFWADQGKNLEEAERLIRKAIDLDEQQRRMGTAVNLDADKENAAYLDSLGWVLFRRGQVEAARTWLDKASALPGGEDDPVVWDHLGDVCARLAQAERAQAAWRKALLLYETEKRRKADEHYQEIKRKLELRP